MVIKQAGEIQTVTNVMHLYTKKIVKASLLIANVMKSTSKHGLQKRLNSSNNKILENGGIN